MSSIRYFNTVGSKEGWTPSTFVSSKSNRRKDAPTFTQKVEDFMDEEDIADAEEAKTLATATAFAGIGSTEEDESRHEAVMDVLRVTGETMGVNLLRKMGWRDGQGIGPKVQRQARLDEEDDPGVNDAQETHFFAPENSPLISFILKNDRKGLGYEGEGRLTDISQKAATGDTRDQGPNDDETSLFRPLKKKEKRQVQRGGFGIGILNDMSDEEDPYHLGPQISYNRVIGGDKKKKKTPVIRKLPVTTSNPLLRTKPVFISKKTSSSKTTRRCHDGRLPLEGFSLASSPDKSFLDKATHYPPPTIPQNWKSSKTPSSTTNPTSNPPPPYQSSADVARASVLNPTTRATLLGEYPLPGKSVFDYLTPSARNRIATATHNPNLPAALSEASPPGHEPRPSGRASDLASLVPLLDCATAITALGRGVGGWMPYAEDHDKRARYRSFLEFRAGLRDGLPDRMVEMGTEEWVKEMQEFAHAAQIFRPMTGMMASRFTSGKATSLDPARTTATGVEGDQENLLSRPVPKAADPAEEAARLGMYGPLTRSTAQFFPTRLLCKRFNVKPPDHVQLDPGPVTSGGAASGASGSGAEEVFGGRFQRSGYQTASKNLELVGQQEMEELRRESALQRGGQCLEEDVKGEVEAVVVDPERNDALEMEKPGEAVFRAIFGSDSEGED